MTHREVTRRLEVQYIRTSFGKITRITTEKPKKSIKTVIVLLISLTYSCDYVT